jgi:hypothetical protein
MSRTIKHFRNQLSLFKPQRLVFIETRNTEDYVGKLGKSGQPDLAKARELLTANPEFAEKIEQNLITENASKLAEEKDRILGHITETKDREKAEVNLTIAVNYVHIKFIRLLKEARQKIEDEQAILNRAFFIEAKIRLEGLLGNEKISGEMENIYRLNCGWSPAELSSLSTEAINKKFPGTINSADIKPEDDPLVAIRMNALMAGARDLFFRHAEIQKDPQFLEKYETYLLFTIHSLKAEKDIVADSDFGNIAIPPEKFYRNNIGNLPERPEGAMTGSQFAMAVLGMSREEFDRDNEHRQFGKLTPTELQNALMMQIDLGNVPNFLRQLKKVTIKNRDGSTIDTYVMPDVIAIGSDTDYIRVPLMPVVAQMLAKRLNLSLPTKAVVDAIWDEAGKKPGDNNGLVGTQLSLTDYTRDLKKDGPYVDSFGWSVRHSLDVDSQLREQNRPPGTLVAGHQKEMVVTADASNRNSPYFGLLHFYGFYDQVGPNGHPVQTSPAHSTTWTEYSLGIRYASQMVTFTDNRGQRRVMSMNEAINNPETSRSLNRVGWQTSQNKNNPIPENPFDPSKAYDIDKVPRSIRNQLFIPT